MNVNREDQMRKSIEGILKIPDETFNKLTKDMPPEQKLNMVNKIRGFCDKMGLEATADKLINKFSGESHS